MPIIEIDGVGRVEVGGEFLNLSPDQQNATVMEIASSFKPQAAPPQEQPLAAPDVKPERAGFYQTMKNEAGEGWQDLKSGVAGAREALSEPHSPAGGVKFAKNVGSAAMGALQSAFSPLTAGVRTQVAEPIEDKTGIPAPVTEFVATMMLPVKKAPKIDTLKNVINSATEGYKSIKGSGVTYAPETTAALADFVTSTLNQKGAYPHLSESVHKTIDLLRSEKDVPIDQLRSIQEALGTLRVDPDSKVRRAAGIASGEIGQFIARTEPEIARQLERANANYSAAKRTQEIDQAAEIADLRTGRAGYGGNSVNSMRQVLSPKVQSAIEGNPNGFNPEEIRAMRDIVEGTTATNTLRGIGQLSPAKGAIQTGLAIGTGGVSALFGTAANKLASALTSKQIDGLRELVLSRAPDSGKVFNPMRDWVAASEGFGLEPTPRNLARLTMAARNFANNLQSAGISVEPNALVRSGLVSSPSASE